MQGGIFIFYHISGTLEYKSENFAVIDANGVGYKLFASLPTLSQLDEIGKPAKLYTYLRVGEDVFDLYGFATQEELSTFNMLLGVSKVGAKVAMAILSTVSPSKLALSVVTNDVNAIKQANGVGPKLAQMIILELKDKFKGADLSNIPGEEVVGNVFDSGNEAVSALIVLGYSPQEAKRAVAAVDPTLELEEVIKDALKKLMR